MANRYFLSSIKGEKAFINGDEAIHLIRVMRVKVGDNLILSNKDGFNYFSTVSAIENNEIICDITKKEENLADVKKRLSVFMALPKSDKLELITQKLCEIGAYELTGFESEFCTALKSKNDEKKKQRLIKISNEASKQSTRSTPMHIGDTLTFKQLVNILKNYEKVLLFYEKSDIIFSQSDFKNYDNVAIIIGSEGGFSQREVEILKDVGAESLSLGKRILRCETAAIVASSLVLYELGELI